jgi:hypothetical protein
MRWGLGILTKSRYDEIACLQVQGWNRKMMGWLRDGRCRCVGEV